MRLLVYTGSAIGLAALLALLWFWGRPAYRHFQEERSLDQAKLAIATGDYRNAELSARRTLELNPANLQACKLMAELAEVHRSTNLLAWRRRIAELEPTPEQKLQTARAALLLESPPFPTASEILRGLHDSTTNLAAFHLVAAEMALRLADYPGAEQHLAHAASLEPTNELHALNLAVLRLQSTNILSRQQGRDALEQLSNHSGHRRMALRSLIADDVLQENLLSASQRSQSLVQLPDATLDDQLEHLTILRRLSSAEYQGRLLEVQQRAGTNAAALYQTCVWLLNQGLGNQALQWITNCPPGVLATQPAPLALADCFIATQNWEALETFLLAQQWGELEFLRYAFLARASSEQHLPLGVQARWRSAVQEARERLTALKTLLKLAEDLGSLEARTTVLREIVKQFPRETWASQELNRPAGPVKNGETRSD